jgi:hypothetical protein
VISWLAFPELMTYSNRNKAQHSNHANYQLEHSVENAWKPQNTGAHQLSPGASVHHSRIDKQAKFPSGFPGRAICLNVATPFVIHPGADANPAEPARRKAKQDKSPQPLAASRLPDFHCLVLGRPRS